MAIPPELDCARNHLRCAVRLNRTGPTLPGQGNRQLRTARASRRLSITINQMDERAHLKHEAGTSSLHDGTAAEKSNMLEGRRIGWSSLHDSPARARAYLRGDNVDSVTKLEHDACQKPP